MKTGPKPRIPTCHPDRRHLAKGLCKRCYDSQYIQARYAADPIFRAYHRTRHLERRYGLSREDYHKLLIAQNFCCKLCDNSMLDPDGRVHNLCVDHDHQTGRIRGLLCKFCNSKLGWFENRREQIEDYLTNERECAIIPSPPNERTQNDD